MSKCKKFRHSLMHRLAAWALLLGNFWAEIQKLRKIVYLGRVFMQFGSHKTQYIVYDLKHLKASPLTRNSRSNWPPNLFLMMPKNLPLLLQNSTLFLPKHNDHSRNLPVRILFPRTHFSSFLPLSCFFLFPLQNYLS